jgi:hypothetical protein
MLSHVPAIIETGQHSLQIFSTSVVDFNIVSRGNSLFTTRIVGLAKLRFKMTHYYIAAGFPSHHSPSEKPLL